MAETTEGQRVAGPVTAPRTPPAPLPHVRPIVIGLMLCMFLVALDGTIVSTAMPRIAGQLGGFSLYAWVPSIYLLTSAVTTPIYGKLSDLYGRKRVLFIGIALFLAGSVLSGASPSMLALIVFRAIQGLGAGAVLPVTTTIIGDIFSLEQRARMQGVFSSVWGVSAVVGPLLGGFLVDNVGWRWIFYLNVPVAIVAVVMIWRYFHEHSVPRGHALDLAGATILACFLTTMLLVLIEGGQAWPWLSVQTAILVAVTIAGILLFVWVELRAQEPVLQLGLFRIRIVLASTIGAFFAGALIVAVTYEVPLFVQGVLGEDALHGGLALAPMSIGWPLAGALSGRIAIRFGYRFTAVCGMLFAAVGVALLLTITETSTFAAPSAFSFLVGIGLGLSNTPLLIAVQSVVTWSRRGMATAAVMFARNAGSVAGLAVMGALVNRATQGVSGATSAALSGTAAHAVTPALLARIHAALVNGIHAAIAAAFIAALFGLVAVYGLPGGSAREHVVQESATAAG